MLYLKIFIVLILCFVNISNFVNCACNVYPKGRKPVLSKFLGSQLILVPDEIDDLELEEEEIIRLYCGTEIVFSSRYTSYNNEKISNNIELKCAKDNIYTKKDYEIEWKSKSTSQINVQCKSNSLSIFESNRSLENCEKYQSYGIGTRLDQSKQLIALKSCFDLLTFQPIYLSYVTHNPDAITDSYMVSEYKSDLFGLDNQLIGFRNFFNFFKFINETDFNKEYTWFSTLNTFLRPHTFEYVNLIQDDYYGEKLEMYKDMFNVIWWRNLRLGNWKIFMDALQQQAKVQQYEIFVGTNGVASFPTDNCKNHKSFTINTNKKRSISAPEYIWSLVTPLNLTQGHEPFVFIGHNSPYLNNTNICKDICNDIDWLNDEVFEMTRKLPSFGLVHCCRPEEVLSIFENFPYIRKVDAVHNDAVGNANKTNHSMAAKPMK